MIARLERVSRRFVDRTRRPRSLKEWLVAPRRPRGEVVALRDVSLEIRRGEAVGLAGPNGAGKTTLLEIVAGILPPTEGTVEVHGRVATLFELGAGFLHERSGRQNVRLAAALHGIDAAALAEREPSILEFAGLGERIDSPFWTYSAGMRLRLAFAVAAHVEAELLLIDETLAVGDAAFQQRCLDWLAGARAAGTAMLLASHVPALLERWCDRVLRLEDGRLAAEDPGTARWAAR